MYSNFQGYQVIGIVGNAKNAGKTTVLNSIIHHINEPLILTSIGLDGEAIDQVTYLEKPQVYVRVDDIVISAKDTIKQWTADYEIIEETNIFTAIGPVILAKITDPGRVLLAGPSLVKDMKEIVDMIRSRYTFKMFIDGAFSRSSFGMICDGLIYVVGANRYIDMSQTIQQALNDYKKLTIKVIPKHYERMIRDDSLTIIKKNQILFLSVDSMVGHIDHIFNHIDKSVQAIYFPKAITDEFVDKWAKSYHQYTFDIIVKTGIHIQLSAINLKKLLTLSHHLYAIKAIDLVSVCINPYAPQGYQYDANDFKKHLSSALGINVINVKEGEQNE